MEWESDSPCHSHIYPGQERWSPGRYSSWELELRDCGAIPGWGVLLTAERWIEQMWRRISWWEMLVEESQAAMEARGYCWVTRRGWSHHHGLSPPHASISSWTIERLAHQTPEALNYRVGPHSVQFSHSVMSDSLRPHGLQYVRPPYLSPTPRAY